MSQEVLRFFFRGAITRIMMCAVVAFAAMLPMPCRCAASVQSGARDSLEMLAHRVSNFCVHVPQEQVFVHMDNTCYFLGDTLYYKAYVLRADSLTLTDMSEVLYAELYNQDGYLVERQMLRLHDGQAHGSFCLPDTIYAGYYELRAYTRWQLNWGARSHPHSRYARRWFLRSDMADDYFRDYDKLYSRVFPVYDKPIGQGEYPQEMTLRPLRRYVRREQPNAVAVVSFYPEGGAWVAGALQNIAFEANDADGKHLQGHLRVQDKDGKVLAEADTEHQGRGMVALQGRSGEAYKANFTWGEGHSVDVEMPMCNGQGVVLSAREQHDTLLVTLHREQMDTVSLGLTLLVGGRFVSGQALQNDTLKIPVAGLPVGVAQVTVYDSSSRVWADRLLFLHQDQVPASNVTVVGPTEADTLAPYGCRELRLQAEGSGVLSVSVYDRGTSVTSRDNATMLTEMLLASQVNGFVEDPLYYFRKTDSAHRRHLDLLLRVQGWRRYRWEDMTQDFALREPFEVSPVIMGDMNKYLPLEQEDYFCHKPSDRLREMKSSMGMVGVSGPNLEDILESTGMGSG